jgi:N-acetylglucosamine kinase-like BadF-type ATPase
MFLGVDSGGTKTALCLISGQGDLVAQTETEGAYYNNRGIELVARVLHTGVTSVCAQAQISPQEVEYAFFGLPGYGEIAGDIPALDQAPYVALGHHRYRCDNDMVCGWAGSLGAVDGINVISGTGSMTYGQRAGIGVRVGGWGELFGDEGSAYWIAIRGLNAVSRMSDGRLPKGPLFETICEHLGLTVELELIDLVLNRWRGDRSKIAGLSRQVSHAADLGDEHAAAVLHEAGRELALLVDATRRRLLYPAGELVPVSYSGGTFSAALVLDAFRRELALRRNDFELRRPLYRPAIGAALLAAKLAGKPLEPVSLAHLPKLVDDDARAHRLVADDEPVFPLVIKDRPRHRAPEHVGTFDTKPKRCRGL